MKLPDDFDRHAIVLTFCVIVTATFCTLLIGLFNPAVNNDDIFKMMTHAFDMIMVGLTGYLGGRSASRGNNAKD